MTKNDALTLCFIVLGFALFGALSGYGLSNEEANVLKELSKGAGSGAGLGFALWFFLLRN